MEQQDKDNSQPDWIYKIKCPFCKKTIVTACDHEVCYDVLEDPEEIVCSEKGYDDVAEPCEHLAFFDDWAYSGPSLTAQWMPQMKAVLTSALTALHEGESGEINDAHVEEELHELLNDMDESSDIERYLNMALPGYAHDFEELYVEKHDGINGCGGPTYRLIFLQSK